MTVGSRIIYLLTRNGVRSCETWPMTTGPTCVDDDWRRLIPTWPFHFYFVMDAVAYRSLQAENQISGTLEKTEGHESRNNTAIGFVIDRVGNVNEVCSAKRMWENDLGGGRLEGLILELLLGLQRSAQTYLHSGDLTSR